MAHAVLDDLSSGGDSKVEEDSEKRFVKEKESKDRDHDREEGLLSRLLTFSTFFFKSVCFMMLRNANYLINYIVYGFFIFADYCNWLFV